MSSAVCFSFAIQSLAGGRNKTLLYYFTAVEKSGLQAVFYLCKKNGYLCISVLAWSSLLIKMGEKLITAQMCCFLDTL